MPCTSVYHVVHPEWPRSILHHQPQHQVAELTIGQSLHLTVAPYSHVISTDERPVYHLSRFGWPFAGRILRTKFPYTSPCGHLYCEDCAIIQFNTDNPSCALCRAPCRFDHLIKLHTTFLQPSTPEIDSPNLDDNPILVHCADALGHLQVGEGDLIQADDHIRQSVSSSLTSFRIISSPLCVLGQEAIFFSWERHWMTLFMLRFGSSHMAIETRLTACLSCCSRL